MHWGPGVRVSRREFLGTGAAAGAVAVLASRLPAADAPAAPRPILKTIPASGEKLPAVGLGTDAFRRDVSDAIRAEIRRMAELGGQVIDTAAAYGDSEALIGQSLDALGLRDRIFIATKLVGSDGAESFARSLQRLKTQHVELLQVHNLNGTAELMPQMQQWKRDGKIRYIGVTTSRVGQHAELMSAMRTFPLDFIQVDYSIANRDAAEGVLPLALERKQAVLINLPFGRSSLFHEAAGRKLPDFASEIEVTSWAQYFLKYVISHPAVTCAIPGSTTVEHLVDNQAAGRGRLPDAAMRRRMEEYWDHPTASAGS